MVWGIIFTSHNAMVKNEYKFREKLIQKLKFLQWLGCRKDTTESNNLEDEIEKKNNVINDEQACSLGDLQSLKMYQEI